MTEETKPTEAGGEDSRQQIVDMGSGCVKTEDGVIHTLTIVGQIEGHQEAPDGAKTTKYEHVLPLLAALEENDETDGLLVLLNTMGGDIEAGLAIAEMIAGMSKPTVSLVLGGGHSIGVPLAVAAKESFIVPSGAMTIHPVRLNGLVIGVSLMAALVAALRGDCRLVLVGDPDQLPSVGPGNVLDHLIRSGVVPAVSLTEIFRQARESAIVMNAHGVNRGTVPELKNKSKDFFYLGRRDAARTVDTIVELCKTRLPQNMGIPPEQIQVLTPTRKRGAGTAALNRALQEALNPAEEGRGERAFGPYIFREGDRVMQVKNNYDLFWEDPDTGEKDLGVFNGDIGTILEVDAGGITVSFDGRLVAYPPELLGELEPAYAVTVHKAQGSEYRAVILALSDVPPSLLARGVLYTAITRARELFILVGDGELMARMVANDRQTKRYSALRTRLLRETGQEGGAAGQG